MNIRGISRRELLGAGIAFGLPSFPDSGFSFVQISDTHIGAPGNDSKVQGLLTEIKAHDPAFVLNLGDVTESGWSEQFDQYRELIKPFRLLIHHAPGNHDVRWSPMGERAFRQGTGDPPFHAFTRQGIRFYLLDSTIPLSHWGHFEASQLFWLHEDLIRQGPITPIVLGFHHWVGHDRVMVDNEGDFYRVIQPYNVRLLMTGHGHSDLFWTWNGIPCTMCKGAYQGSYLKVQVEPKRHKMRIFRRTTAAAETFVADLSLTADFKKPFLWNLGGGILTAESLPIANPKVTESSWDDLSWVPVELGSISTAKLDPGFHRLRLRKDQATTFDAGYGEVPEADALQLQWRKPLSGGVMSHLRYFASSLYVSTMDGNVLALNSEDGSHTWNRSLGGFCHSSPYITSHLVFCGSSNGYFYALDRATGKIEWRSKTEGPIYASPVVAGEIVVIASGDGAIYGFRIKDGHRMWRYELPEAPNAFSQSPAASDGKRVFVGAWDKFLYSIDAANGELAWKKDTCSPKAWPYSAAVGGPAVADDRVIVPCDGNILWCFDANSGEVIWQTSSPGDKFGYSSPTIKADQIVIGCLGDKGEVRSISTKTGLIEWTTATGSVIYDSSPAVQDTWTVVGSVDGKVSILGLATGNPIGSYQLRPGHLLASPATSTSTVYIASFANEVVSLKVSVTTT